MRKGIVGARKKRENRYKGPALKKRLTCSKSPALLAGEGNKERCRLKLEGDRLEHTHHTD